ncbi:hypothetical protein [Maribacter hydrothermalis]|uniref:Limiting CO2-inducible protein B/C beta carbonyic anhydrase domain-containing protein n=1 Tax=Maribacter hydrothermalis TaxID=1836467 RepID=A0A1B7Z7I9_9FLAO|nr:hypothetical protein [Maribacter hydrothermalis]APQ15933.1 hypothetical protein BTR34_00615 [Maribacter hydrothermalis]OBR38688.1 hypothetical protein A9200_03195 [Maribacter hydrothermalis]
MSFLKTVKEHYPNALTTEDTVNKLLDIIESNYGLKPNQLMHADSLCCDDVNAIQYPPRAYEMLGPFKLGGLDGYPFAGITGMGAFAHHVPEDGAIVIFYAPHIGVTKEGKIGEINRYGQSQNSSCCGAAKAGLSKLQNNKIVKGAITDLDYQMNTIEQILLEQKARILSSEIPIKEATEVIYEAIDKQIDVLVSKTNYPCKHLFQIGAVFINGDRDMGSFCSYKRFEYINLETNKRTDLMSNFS